MVKTTSSKLEGTDSSAHLKQLIPFWGLPKILQYVPAKAYTTHFGATFCKKIINQNILNLQKNQYQQLFLLNNPRFICRKKFVKIWRQGKCYNNHSLTVFTIYKLVFSKLINSIKQCNYLRCRIFVSNQIICLLIFFLWFMSK